MMCLVRLVEDRLPVRDVPHVPAGAELLAELTVLRLGVAAPVRVVEGDVQQEWRR